LDDVYGVPVPFAAPTDTCLLILLRALSCMAGIMAEATKQNEVLGGVVALPAHTPKDDVMYACGGRSA